MSLAIDRVLSGQLVPSEQKPRYLAIELGYPFLRKINATDTKTYATRTIIFLQNDGTLKPLAIELSKPHPQADSFGPVSKVYMPVSEGVEASIWFLAKAFVVVNDATHHQLCSQWY